jgi:hypothetical protein
MRRFVLLAVASMLAVFFVSPLFAEDFWPPDFRSDPLTYTAYWEFTNDPGPGDIWPDLINSVGYGEHELFTAVTHAHRDINFVFWDPAGFLFTGDAPGQIDFFLNNWVDVYVYKHIWIQVTYSSLDQPPYVSSVLGADESLQWSDPYIGYFVQRQDVDANHFVEYWQIQPNPNMEHIYLELPPNVSIDEVVIDTWSTDSPVSNEEKSWGGVKALFR